MIMSDFSPIIAAIRQRLAEVNLVSYSGGKDSSVVLQLVFNALAGTGKKLYIVTADTRMEIPYFQEYVERTKVKIREYIASAEIDAEVVTVSPPARDSFWVSVLGKGYPAAHMGFRWCTGKLKIDPITRFTKIKTEGKTSMVFVGVRAAESELRARIYKEHDYKPGHYAPILDWSAADVWEYLLTEPCLWGDHSELVQVYRYSSDECVYGEKQGVCIGNARYGCWACPLQKSTQLDMLAMHTGDDRYRELKHFKECLSGMANKKAYRSRIRRNGEVGAGPFLVEIRQSLFADMLKLQQSTGWKLIDQEEVEWIKEYWDAEKNIHHQPCNDQPMLWDHRGVVACSL
jgi:DNA sulfur modification protein DndC